MIGQTISHYRVVEKLGEGGMGVVYKAEDAKLERTVALKFLPAEALGSSADKRRFVQEARAAASLDHPSICTIYEIDEADGETFISMAYVEGQSLRELVDRGPIPIEMALDIAIQIAEGLDAAHEQGIIHRDIKSANIMVNDRGYAKIMDFGLAKIADGTSRVRDKSTMGTVAYMSPEQTRGDDVDYRTDIWSLGIIMYEMLIGLRPFRGTYEQSVIYSICNEEPQPVTALRTGVPMEFERIITKALSKHPKDRYADARQLAVDLRRLKVALESGAVATSSRLRGARGSRRRAVIVPTLFFAVAVVAVSAYLLRFVQHEAVGSQIPIAVADFANETGDAHLDGLSGMLITSLEQSRRLSVLTRSSMFDVLRQMGKEDVTRVDEELGREVCRFADINVLVVASIRLFDDLYSIDLKAFDMNADTHLFTAREEGRGRSSIPAMIDRIAEKTRKSLNENSAAINATSEKIADITTRNLDAYQQFFLGEQYIDQLRFDDARKAFYRAIDLDSTFALAHYRLAYANWWGHQSEDVQRAQLDKALSLERRLPEKYRLMLQAQNAVFEMDYSRAIDILKRAERLYPDEKEVLYNIGDYSYHAERFEDAARYLTRVLEMDPTFERALNHLTMTYAAMKDVDRAIEVGRRYLELSKSRDAYRLLSSVYLMAGDRASALDVVEAGLAEHPGNAFIVHQLAMVKCMNDDFDSARAILVSLAGDSTEPYVRQMSYSSLVGANLYMGRYRDALAAAEEAITIALQRGDSLQAAFYQQLVGIIYVWGWRDAGAAADAFERADRLIDGVDLSKADPRAEQRFWSNRAIFYILAGEDDIAEEIAREHVVGSSEESQRLRFFVHWKNDDYAAARAVADSLLNTIAEGQKTMLLYFLADAQLEHGRLDEAMTSLEQLQSNMHSSGVRPFFYPPSYVLLAQGQERTGKSAQAMESYSRFLTMWKGADRDLPLYRQAQSRLAALQSKSMQ